MFVRGKESVLSKERWINLNDLLIALRDLDVSGLKDEVLMDHIIEELLKFRKED